MIIKVFLEIRAGTGGDESALFAGDLFKCTVNFLKKENGKLKYFTEPVRSWWIQGGSCQN